ncbi:putative defense protein 3 [Chiloscyllium plagiosum]|uniref:putative defense protein 3 n=1 Tax=Chiloscyllium plagiosum TaxID=36176 RepID=UPI001CB888F8|nr:putative defense protein 3 [Chiloscyllium plagiosum]
MEKPQLRLVVLVVLAACWPAVSPLPSGAPLGSCGSMAPRHNGVTPQTGPSPYSIMVKNYTDKVEVTVMGSSYRGILLEARYPNQMDAIGTWAQPPNNTKKIACFNKMDSAITHSNTYVKANVTYTWISPCSKNDTIIFLATVAENREIYWVKLASDPVRVMCSGSAINLHGFAALVMLMISAVAVL